MLLQCFHIMLFLCDAWCDALVFLWRCHSANNELSKGIMEVSANCLESCEHLWIYFFIVELFILETIPNCFWNSTRFVPVYNVQYPFHFLFIFIGVQVERMHVWCLSTCNPCSAFGKQSSCCCCLHNQSKKCAVMILGQLFDSSVYYPLDMHDLMLNLLLHVGHNQFFMWLLARIAQNSICKRHILFAFQCLQLPPYTAFQR